MSRTATKHHVESQGSPTDPVPPGAHSIACADRLFYVSVHDDDNGHATAGHADRFVDFARAQLRALWAILAGADSHYPMTADELQSFVGAIEATLGMSDAMRAESERIFKAGRAP